MSAPPPYPPHPPGVPPRQVDAAPPPVRTAIVLVWVQLGVQVASVMALLVVSAVDGWSAAGGAGPAPSGGLLALGAVLAVVGGLVPLVWPVAYAVVVAVFLRRGHRWVRVVVMVFAGLNLLSLAFSVLGATLSTTVALVLGSAAPGFESAAGLATDATLTALDAAVLVLLFRPAARRWLDVRTAQRRRAALARRGAIVTGPR